MAAMGRIVVFMGWIMASAGEIVGPRGEFELGGKYVTEGGINERQVKVELVKKGRAANE